MNKNNKLCTNWYLYKSISKLYYIKQRELVVSIRNLSHLTLDCIFMIVYIWNLKFQWFLQKEFKLKLFQKEKDSNWESY